MSDEDDPLNDSDYLIRRARERMAAGDHPDMIRELPAETVAAWTDNELAEAGRRILAVRQRNTGNGTLILDELKRRIDPATGRPYSWRKIETLTGIKERSARRWGKT